MGAGILCGVRCSVEEKNLIVLAGNAESEKVRHQLLTELLSSQETSDAIKKDLEKILPLVDHWANGRDRAQEINDPEKSNRYLMHFVSWRQVNFETVFPPEIAESSPLYPIWCLYRGRLLIYVTIQISDIRMNPELRDQYYHEGIRLVKIAHQAFPENRVTGIYLGQSKPWKVELPGSSQAPKWAQSQRESIERLREIIYWWIDNRQLEFGGFGGGWNDDCEMWRWWAPLLIGFEDPKIIAAQEKLSKAMLSRPILSTGFTERMTDVEHSAEETSDVITPMMHLKPHDPYWERAALKLIDFSKDLWGGVNSFGNWQFKTSYFTSSELDLKPGRACDTHYHFRLMQPMLLYWQRTRDSGLTDFFSNWMYNWLSASMREDKGKPRGVIPSAIHWPDGLSGGLDPNNWWAPGNYSSPIYDWPRGVNTIATNMVLAYHLTGDDAYLEPLKEMVALRQQYLNLDLQLTELSPGSKPWCAVGLISVLSEPLAKYRALTGDTDYDQYLLRDADDYVKYRLSGQREILVESLAYYGSAIQSNFEIYTSEVRHTDRVLAFNDYFQETIDPTVPSSRRIASLLYQTITGDLGSLSYFPMNAVRWKTLPKDLAVLVTDSSTSGLIAELYNFQQQPKTFDAELYLLDHGRYQLRIESSNGEILNSRQIEISQSNRTITISIPPAKEVKLVLALI